MAVPGLPVAALFALLLGIGTLASLESGARSVLVRASASEAAYVPARSLMRIAVHLAQLGGNAAGGTLLLVLSPRGALLANAASFACSAAAVRLGVADHPNAGGAGERALLRDSLEGARTVLRLPEVRRLLLLGWLVPMLSVAPEAVAAPYVADRHGSSALVGWWLVALPVGLIVGDVVGVRFLDQRAQRRLILPAAAAGFVPYLAFAAAPRIPLGIALLVCSGLCSLYMLGLDGRVREAVPAELFARAMALSSAGLMTLQGLGFALAGAVAQATSAGTAIALAGAAGLAVVAALARADRRSRRLHPLVH